MPEPTNLHVDAIMTNLSVKYRNEAMLWRGILPELPVGKRSDKYFTYNKEDSFMLADDVIGPVAMPNQIEWGVSSANYSVTDHALSTWLSQEAIDNADSPIAPELDTNDFLNLALDIAQEKRVVDLVFAAATYPTANKVVLSGTGQWSGSADDPIGDLVTAIETPFVRANTLVFGQEAWIIFRKLPEVLDAVKGATRFQGTPGGLATAAEVANLLEVDNIYVGRARYNTAKEGQTASYSRLWGKHCAALHVVKNPGIKTVTFGVSFTETRRQTQRVFDVKRGVKGAHFFKVAWNSDEKIIASDLGYFIQDAVA